MERFTSMNGNWIKVVLFLLGVTMLAGIASVLLDHGYGRPDESRRVRHPGGFSFIPPRGWGGSTFRSPEQDFLRIAPERSSGRQPSIGVLKYAGAFTPDAEAKPTTFQGQPALVNRQRTRYAHIWHIQFQRNGTWYMIELNSPLRLDVETGPLMEFVNSFRIERELDLSALKGAGLAAPASMPATEPVGPLLP